MGAPVRIGDVLAEKYRITRILGAAGLATMSESIGSARRQNGAMCNRL